MHRSRTLATTVAMTLAGAALLLTTVTGSASASLATHPHPRAPAWVQPMTGPGHMGCREHAPLT